MHVPGIFPSEKALKRAIRPKKFFHFYERGRIDIREKLQKDSQKYVRKREGEK
jgi:hypothetical protein